MRQRLSQRDQLLKPHYQVQNQLHSLSVQPVVEAVIRVRDAEEAIEVANDTQFGLGANLWTGDIDAGRGLARRIEAGSVFINGMVASDPRLPFGGVRQSGYGRELQQFGIREFVNIQTVWIGPTQGAQALTTQTEWLGSNLTQQRGRILSTGARGARQGQLRLRL